MGKEIHDHAYSRADEHLHPTWQFDRQQQDCPQIDERMHQPEPMEVIKQEHLQEEEQNEDSYVSKPVGHLVEGLLDGVEFGAVGVVKNMDSAQGIEIRCKGNIYIVV